MKPKHHLVIGCDGFLGRHIVAQLKQAGKSVITTSRRKKKLSASCFYLDLGTDLANWEVPKNVDVAYLCAAVTSIEQCRKYTIESRKINVDNTILIAAKLAAHGIAIVYPSTNLVFDGQLPFRKSEDALCPQIEYGRQKGEAENGLLSIGQRVAIVRFSKILNSQTPLVINWIKHIKKNKVIRPFSDMKLAPVSVDFAVNVLMTIAQKKKYGIFQVSAKKDISYEELARYIAQKLSYDQMYIKPIKAKDSKSEFESIPKYTTLDTTRIVNVLGLFVPDVWDTVDELFGLQDETSQST